MVLGPWTRETEQKQAETGMMYTAVEQQPPSNNPKSFTLPSIASFALMSMGLEIERKHGCC